MIWSRASLQAFARESLDGCKLIVVSNREPYIHTRRADGIECQRPASGMAAALDPVIDSCGGAWVAHGSGNADREFADEKGRLHVPPENPSYTLRRIWLTKAQEYGYYYGLSNEGLWPLCHIAFRQPVFRHRDWQRYRDVNKIFAEAVLEEAGDETAFVFIQDYHLGLLPRMLKKRNPKLIIAQFWHIPWPNREIFRAFPWKEELLDGLLGNDLIGFHLHYHCQNFLDTVDRGIEAKVELEHRTVTRGGRTTAVRAFPISIDFEAHTAEARSAEVQSEMDRWRLRLQPRSEFLGLGIDRIDYTKGIPERLQALDLFFEEYPAYRGRLVFVQIGVPSRTQIREYQRLTGEIDSLVRVINRKWSTAGWSPIVFFKQHFGPNPLMALHRLADFCMVNSLHDGMNLVAKEFVASRFYEDGVLILSKFTGSARELNDALLVNPFDLTQCADAIRRALEMPQAERSFRMRRMRAVVARRNIYRWASKIIGALSGFHIPESLGSTDSDIEIASPSLCQADLPAAHSGTLSDRRPA